MKHPDPMFWIFFIYVGIPIFLRLFISQINDYVLLLFQIRKDGFLDVVGDQDLCRINNSLDARRAPYPPIIVVDRALTRVFSSKFNKSGNRNNYFN